MRIVIAPDSFKGSLSQVEVAETIQVAINQMIPSAQCVVKPMADGGEGTLVACARGRSDLRVHSISVTGARGEKRKASIGFTNDGVAVVEIAEIVGLELISQGQQNPSKMTTYGIGEAILYCLDQGVNEIIVGLGGSSTNDGGIGLLQALGATIQGENFHTEVPLLGEDLKEIERVDLSTIDKRIYQTTIRIASDVTNPLVGKNGATFVFAPQKGARIEDLQTMDGHLKKYIETIHVTHDYPTEIAEQQGAGAAGGLGFALLLLRGNMEQGAHVVGDMINLDQAIQQADLVITGEGKTDSQTKYGKVPFYVATRAKHFSVPAILVSGNMEHADWLDSYFKETIALVSKEISRKQAMQETKAVLTEAIYTIFRRMTK